VLLGIFGAFFIRLFRIAERAPDDYSRFLVVGIIAWLSTQAIINIGAMLGMLPLKGITLPFISYGGTSILFVTGAVGLVFQISRYTSFGVQSEGLTERGRNDYSPDRRGIRGAYHPNPSGR
jgi:cell division protein FtsW